jgi:hypothetical protein
MKSVKLSALSAALFLATLPNIFAAVPGEVHLTDLPRTWKGVVGDLMTRKDASIEITSIGTPARQEYGTSVELTYPVQGLAVFGENRLAIDEVTVHSSPSQQPGSEGMISAEVTIHTQDELAPFLNLMVVQGRKANGFVLKDAIRHGQRHLILRGTLVR